MFDNDDRVAFIHQLVQYPQQDPDILEVQTGGRFIQYIKRLSRIPLRQLGSQLDTLLSPPDKVVEGCPNLIYPRLHPAGP